MLVQYRIAQHNTLYCCVIQCSRGDCNEQKSLVKLSKNLQKNLIMARSKHVVSHIASIILYSLQILYLQSLEALHHNFVGVLLFIL